MMTGLCSGFCSSSEGRKPTTGSFEPGSVDLRSLNAKEPVIGLETPLLFSISMLHGLRDPVHPGSQLRNLSRWRRCGRGMPLNVLGRLKTTPVQLESERSRPCLRRLSPQRRSASGNGPGHVGPKSWRPWPRKMASRRGLLGRRRLLESTRIAPASRVSYSLF